MIDRVHLDQTAVLGEILHAHVVRVPVANVDQAERVVRGLPDALQGGAPLLLVQQQRLHQTGHERTVPDRDQIHPLRQILIGQRQGALRSSFVNRGLMFFLTHGLDSLQS